MELADTALFCRLHKEMWKPGNRGSFKARTRGWYFSLSQPEEWGVVNLIPLHRNPRRYVCRLMGKLFFLDRVGGKEKRSRTECVYQSHVLLPSCALPLSAAASTPSWHFVVLNTRALNKIWGFNTFFLIYPVWAAKVNRILHECTFDSYEQKLKAKTGSAISNQSPQSKTLVYGTTRERHTFPFKEICLEDQLHNFAS